MSAPRVSILMAAYNAQACIDRAIASVRAQTVTDWELIVVDDCSTDDTTARVAARVDIDPRIRLVRQPTNQGPSAARNAAIDCARGSWLTILDADDAYRPDRLAHLLRTAAETGADFVADNLMLFDQAAGTETGAAYPVTPGPVPLTVPDMLRSETKRGAFSLGFAKPMIRASLLRSSGVRYSERLRFAEDFLLYLELLLAGAKAVRSSAALYVYTTQTGAVSGTKSATTHTRFTPFTRVEIARHLLERYGASASAGNIAALHRYETYATRYAHAHAMSECKNDRRYGEMVTLMARQPRAAIRFLLAQKPLRQIFGTGL